MEYKDVNCSNSFTAEAQQALLKLNPGEDRAQIYGQRLVDRAKAGDLSSVEVLRNNDADINFQDQHGMTALHHLAAAGFRPGIRLLNSFNECNYLLQDNKGRLASELAYEWGRDYAVGLLLQKKEVRQAHQQSLSAKVPQLKL